MSALNMLEEIDRLESEIRLQLFEGKTFGASDIEVPGRSHLAAANYALGGPEVNRRIATEAARQYAALKDSLGENLASLLTEYDAGRITAGQLSFRIKSTIRESYTRAFDLGMRSEGWLGGIQPNDEKWLRSAYREEWTYLNEFMTALAGDRLIMAAGDRLNMYRDTVDAMFWAGKVEASPAGALVYWRMSVAEHCGDCLNFAANSPYTRETLPSTPRAGDSQCLSHCKCYLEIAPAPGGTTATGGPTQAEDVAVALPLPVPPVAPIVPAGLRLPTNDEQAVIDALAVKASYLRQYAASSEGAMAEKLVAQRDEAATGLLGYLKSNKLFLKNKWPIDSAVMGQPVTDEQRNSILSVSLSIGAIAVLMAKKKSETDSLTEQFLACIDGKTL